MIHSDDTHIDHTVKVFNRILFFLYSFAYLAFYQTDLERYVHVIITDGAIPFRQYLLAFIFSLIVVLVEIPFSLILRFKGGWDACNYIPTVFLLSISTSHSRQYFLGHQAWVWIVIFAIFVLFVLLMKLISELNWRDRENIVSASLKDIVILVILMLLPPLLGNSDERFHRELRAERLMSQGKYEDILSVGLNAEETSSRLEYLRAEALARIHPDNSAEGSELGRHLFDYPQHYAVSTANALVMEDTVSSKAGFENRKLAALLLQRNVSVFVQRLLTPPDSAVLSVTVWRGEMPTYYMQAILLHDRLSGDSTEVLYQAYPEQAAAQRKLLDAYMTNRDANADEREQYRANTLFNDYHRTYWWYYDFGRL